MIVSINYYTYRPRLRLFVIVDIPEPQVNDEIVIPIKWFSEVGKFYKSNRVFIKMIVESRAINCLYIDGPMLIVNLKLIDDAKTSMKVKAF